MDMIQKIELTNKAISAAAEWIRDEFDPNFLHQLEKHKLIKQEEGYLHSLITDLQVTIERAMLDGQLLQDIEGPFVEDEENGWYEAEDIGCNCTEDGVDSEWVWSTQNNCYICSGCNAVQ